MYSLLVVLKKRNHGKVLVNTFPFSLFHMHSGENAIRFPITKSQANLGKSQANLGKLSGRKRGGDKDEKGKMNIIRLLRDCVS